MLRLNKFSLNLILILVFICSIIFIDLYYLLTIETINCSTFSDTLNSLNHLILFNSEDDGEWLKQGLLREPIKGEELNNINSSLDNSDLNDSYLKDKWTKEDALVYLSYINFFIGLYFILNYDVDAMTLVNNIIRFIRRLSGGGDDE